MKILQITFSLSSGGAEHLTVDLCNQLNALGHDVTLCLIRDLSIPQYSFYLPEISPNIKLINLKIKPGFSLRYFSGIFNAIRSVKPDVVHVHLAGVMKYIMPIREFFPKIQFIHTIHNDAKAQSLSAFDRVCRRLLYKSNRFKAITISDETTKSFENFYHISPYAQIYNGRSTLNTTAEYENVKNEISSLKQTPDDLIFLHLGRCVEQKNQQMLINTFNRLAKEGEKVTLLVLGAGFDTQYGKRLISTAGKNIHFLGQKSNVSDYYFASDAFCLSSIFEGMPITVIEAFCSGCTPICTPVGGTIDVITNGETGILSEDLSEDSYYTAVQQFIKHRIKKNKSELQQHFIKNFSIEKCAQEYNRIYNSNAPDHIKRTSLQ